MEKIYRCRSLSETAAAAREVAAQLKGKETLAFYGDLGAGKTTFIRYLCEALGLSDEVTSPTYAMIHEYMSGAFPIYHFDMYRVDGLDSLFSTGYYDYLETGLMLIEWSEHIEEALPPDHWRIAITHGETPEERLIRVERNA